AAYLAFLGKKTLLIDFDPQFNATVGLGINNDSGETIYEALFSDKNIREVIQPTYLSNLDVIPSSGNLAGAIIELANEENREYYLKIAVDQIKDDYDFIFIDMAPSLSLLTINGLIAANEVIIPVQCEYYSLEGLNQLLETLSLIKNNMGHDLKVGGALITMYDKEKEVSRETAKQIRDRFPYYVFRNKIPRSSSLSEAPSFSRPVILYDPKSEGGRAYEELAKEIISQGLKLSTVNPEFEIDSLSE
ncbi:MAG: AAA family ATPase, partial [Candidatus Paceibacterota bacterium]